MRWEKQTATKAAILPTAGWPQAPGRHGAPGLGRGGSRAAAAPGSPLQSWLLYDFIEYKNVILLIPLRPSVEAVARDTPYPRPWGHPRCGGRGLGVRGRGPRGLFLAGSHKAAHRLLALFTYLLLYLFVYMKRLLPALTDKRCLKPAHGMTGWADTSGALPFPHGGGHRCLPDMASTGAAVQKKWETYMPCSTRCYFSRVKTLRWESSYLLCY